MIGGRALPLFLPGKPCPAFGSLIGPMTPSPNTPLHLAFLNSHIASLGGRGESVHRPRCVQMAFPIHSWSMKGMRRGSYPMAHAHKSRMAAAVSLASS